MKHVSLLFAFILLMSTLPACQPEPEQPATNITRPVESSDLRLVQGQTVYVPAYSEIFTSGDKAIPLTVTLAIHNTDPTHAIVIQSVRYYDTAGDLVKNYLESPVEIGPLATAGYVIEEADTRGGWGANFIVEWGADQDVYEPVIEAVMIGSSFGQSLSLISPGRVVSEAPPGE